MPKGTDALFKNVEKKLREVTRQMSFDPGLGRLLSFSSDMIGSIQREMPKMNLMKKVCRTLAALRSPSDTGNTLRPQLVSHLAIMFPTPTPSPRLRLFVPKMIFNSSNIVNPIAR